MRYRLKFPFFWLDVYFRISIRTNNYFYLILNILYRIEISINSLDFCSLTCIHFWFPFIVILLKRMVNRLTYISIFVCFVLGRTTSIISSSRSIDSSSLSCSPLTVQLDTPVSTTAPYFASWNIDSSRNRAFFDTDWSNKELIYLANSIGGAKIRFGGSGNDDLNYAVDGYSCPPPGNSTECLNVTTAKNLFAFAQASQNDLIFGLNIHPTASGKSPPSGPWNASNAEALLRWSLENGSPPWALELGNEQNDAMSAYDQAMAFGVLSSALDTIFGSNNQKRPLLIGPDTHGFHQGNDTSFNVPLLNYLNNFIGNMSALGLSLDAVTHHEYIEVDEFNVIDPDYLDNTVSIGQQVVTSIRSVSSTLPIWAGEIGPHNGQGTTSANSNCANNHVCGRFGSTLWYADALGSKATVGYQGFMRQDLIGAYYALINTTLTGEYFPTPDYYFLKIWRETVMNKTSVLSVSPPNGSPRTTRIYSFCGNGDIVLVMLNVANTSSVCIGPPNGIVTGSTMRVYTLTPATSDGVTAVSTLLNGQLLELNSQGLLPILNPLISTVGDITLPPLSVTIAVMSLQPNSGTAQQCMV